ncbi:unnamed protein product [Schistocephalus solidus]|uniref:G_PROTEIN_RECEP_F1_2 domain-containing protein n=1 Tax=Schistocephalus solidus TaxID=70667 RepID=A0A183TKN0_SCHSO|nr:unnamed protein product [Schistocephalus solidus]
MSRKRMTAHVESKPFWKCEERTSGTDGTDVVTYILDCIGILLNALILVLIFKKHCGPRVSLVLIRGMITCYLLTSAVNFLDHIYPYRLQTQNYHFNRLLCLFWDSRFFYWIFNVMGGLFLAIFAVDRLFCLAQLDLYRVTVPEYRLTSYVIFAVVASLLFSLPLLLSVNLNNDQCDCAPIQINIPFLSVIFAHVYLWFALLLVFQGGLLVFISVQLISWKLKRISTHLSWRTADDLNSLTLKQPADATISLRGRARTLDGDRTCDDKRRNWNSASFCILPLTLSYVLTSVYDSTYQFLSAVGLTTYIINSVEQRLGEMLIVVHFTAVPLIICLYIPSLRVYLWLRLKSAFKKKAGSTVP